MAETVGVEEQQAAAGAEQSPPLPKLKLSRRGIVVLCGLVAALLGTGVWLVWFSSVFDVRTVTVVGRSCANERPFATGLRRWAPVTAQRAGMTMP